MKMRGIKFRGKRVDTGEWVYGYYYKKPSGKNYIYNSQTRLYHEVDPATVGRYTGRKDKRGRKIYTGQQLRITMYDYWDGREIDQQESVVEFRDSKYGITWSGQFREINSFGYDVTFEVVGEEGES
jgi:hypothetical protein